jgi:hypothetical protein
VGRPENPGAASFRTRLGKTVTSPAFEGLGRDVPSKGSSKVQAQNAARATPVTTASTGWQSEL